MNTTPPKKRFPWLKLALVVSVVLNFAALGVLGGVIARAGAPGGMLRSAVAALPEEDRRALRRETREIWREAGTQRWGGAETHRALTEALRAEDFDPAAFEAALTTAQERLRALSAKTHARLVSRVSQMSLQERRDYADALEAQRARFAERRWARGER